MSPSGEAFDGLRVVPPFRIVPGDLGVPRRSCGTKDPSTGPVSTDSHTTMINGLGVVGWGQGIEGKPRWSGSRLHALPKYGSAFRLPRGFDGDRLVLQVTERCAQAW
jgi:hypothetical protein